MQKLKIKQLQSGMLIQNAQKLLVYIAQKTRSKFYAYYVCCFPTADIEHNKNCLVNYAKSVINSIMVGQADSKRIVVSSLSKNNDAREQTILYFDELLDREYFKSWYLKNKLLNSGMPSFKDYKDLLRETDNVGIISLPYMERGHIYRTKKGTIFSMYLGANRFLVVPEKYLEDLKQGNYESFKEYLLQISDKQYKMYYGNCYLYKTEYFVDVSFLEWLKQSYKSI